MEPLEDGQAVLQFDTRLDVFLSPQRRAAPVLTRFKGNPALKHLVEALGVPHTEVGEVLIQGQPGSLGAQIQNGDRIEIGAFHSTQTGVSDSPAPCFILDNHLGRLAAYLRMLGFDAAYRNDIQDEELARTAFEEGRILLSRDRRLLMRRIVERGGYVYSSHPPQQLGETIQRFGLAGWIKPFHRCLRCNQELQPTKKSDVLVSLQPLTRLYFDEFQRCPGCGQVYWKGSHYQHMLELIRTVSEKNAGEAQ